MRIFTGIYAFCPLFPFNSHKTWALPYFDKNFQKSSAKVLNIDFVFGVKPTLYVMAAVQISPSRKNTGLGPACQFLPVKYFIRFLSPANEWPSRTVLRRKTLRSIPTRMYLHIKVLIYMSNPNKVSYRIAEQ